MKEIQRTDWLEIWNTVSGATRHTAEMDKINSGKKHFRRDSAPRHDPLLDFVLEQVESGHTVIDIGAGSGRWTIPLAAKVKAVTAIEPSQSMREMLQENIGKAGVNNISIVTDRWEQADIEPHDIVTCTHAIYETLDFESFVRKMESCARERCYLVLRLPPHDGIVGELMLKIHGHPYDSPNAVIAYNALYGLGIYVNILVEEDMHRWKDDSIDDAFQRAKRHVNITTPEYDTVIRETLERKLECRDGVYFWPDGMRSALFWWDTKH